MTETKKAPVNFAKSPAQYLAATKHNRIIAQKTIKTKRSAYRVTIERTRFNQFVLCICGIVFVLLAYMILGYLLGVPGDAALRIVG